MSIATQGDGASRTAARSRFLAADWRDLAMVNFEVDPALLQPFVPRGTELDSWGGRTLVSVVGFMFLNTRVLGFPIPFHRNFEEVNLRFYVRRHVGDEVRRGVVFIREIVPLHAIAIVARWFYNENYVARRMSHRLQKSGAVPEIVARYAWRDGGSEASVEVSASGAPQSLVEGSEAEFIAQHYWGYAIQRDGGTVEYEVEHPSWRVWECEAGRVEGDVSRLYGPRFASVVQQTPSSVFLAEGSQVVVHRGQRIA